MLFKLCRDDGSVLQAWEVHYRPCSLVSCLNDFMQAERLDDEIMCKPCGKKCPTTKALAIWRLPKILVCLYHLACELREFDIFTNMSH